jgi:hypothetical protein
MKLSNIKEDDELIFDNSFTCLEAGKHKVKSTKVSFYVDCKHGRHYLDGQEDENGELVGISK